MGSPTFRLFFVFTVCALCASTTASALPDYKQEGGLTETQIDAELSALRGDLDRTGASASGRYTSLSRALAKRTLTVNVLKFLAPSTLVGLFTDQKKITAAVSATLGAAAVIVESSSDLPRRKAIVEACTYIVEMTPVIESYVHAWSMQKQSAEFRKNFFALKNAVWLEYKRKAVTCGAQVPQS